MLFALNAHVSTMSYLHNEQSTMVSCSEREKELAEQ